MKNYIPLLKKMLNHEEANIRWDSAIALAKMNDHSGKLIINDLLNMSVLQFQIFSLITS